MMPGFRRSALTRVSRLLLLAACAVSSANAACDQAPRRIELPALPARTSPEAGAQTFVCKDESSHGCQGDVYSSCVRQGEFIQVVETDCAAQGLVCDNDRKCIACRAGSRRCRDCTGSTGQLDDCNSNIIEACDDSGDGYTQVDECGVNKPEVCFQGDCKNACALAQSQNTYAGCEFFAADLDNAAIDDMNNASAQQYAVVVANPQRVPVEVTVERNDAAYGDTPKPSEVDKKMVAPGDLQVFKLPRREVDGSSQNGINDGTNSAVSSNAYRVVSNYPIAAYQFNPLENVNVFSNDASLLLPVPALGSDYTVVGWPQTIGNSSNPEQDFDHTSSSEDLRAFLTILGVQEQTTLRVELGQQVVQVVGTKEVTATNPGDVMTLNIGPFDVVNLETQGFNADFTGTRVHSSNPVAVFVGSEASDVPRFGTYATRQCCADHLEEQLLPDRSAGTRFVVGRMPNRTHALNNAALPGAPLGVAEVNEPEWIRVVTVTPGITRITTTLDPPDDDLTLSEAGDVILRADRDFIIESDQPIHVLEALASQGVTGIPRQYPGGDPSIITIPPVDQFRRDYIFLTPDKYAFDFVTIVAPPNTNIQLDGAPLPEACAGSPADGIARSSTDPTPEWVVHRCQLSFPDVTNGSSAGGLMGGGAPSVVQILPGAQHDGAHTVVADQPVSIIIYGFDRFVSYAYVGGLNLASLN